MSYKPDRSGMRKLARSPQMQQVVVAATNRGMEWAKRVPVNGPSRLLPEYRAGFRVEPTTVVVGGESRVGALLINSSDVERIFGARNRVLYRAIAQIEGVQVR